jgi:RNA-directed DNA polymerase
MVKGRFRKSREGVPQGGPLSPLLANILLDDLDKELEKRGHRFARYADDFIILVKTERAGLAGLKKALRAFRTINSSAWSTRIKALVSATDETNFLHLQGNQNPPAGQGLP